jgi:hypothetical protein
MVTRRAWAAPTTSAEATRRGVGRNRHNRERQDAALLRRVKILELWDEGAYLPTEHGARALLARQLGVDRSTISRDFRWLWQQMAVSMCPTCETPVIGGWWRELEREGRVRFTP